MAVTRDDRSKPLPPHDFDYCHEPTEDQVDEWRDEVESETGIVGEPPV